MTVEQILTNPTTDQIRQLNNVCCKHYIVPTMIYRVHGLSKNGNVAHGLIIQLNGYKTFIQITNAHDPYLMPKHTFNAVDIQHRPTGYYSIGGYISTNLSNAVGGALAILHNRYAKK